jgi:hypothetical protein
MRATALRSTPTSRVGFSRSSRIAEVCPRGSLCGSGSTLSLPPDPPEPRYFGPCTRHERQGALHAALWATFRRAPVLAHRVMRMKIACNIGAASSDGGGNEGGGVRGEGD